MTLTGGNVPVVVLRGVAWDHPRGIAPMRATAAVFHQLRPDVVVQWETRSLVDFAFYPVEELSRDFDLVLIDHPHIGPWGANADCLVPVDEWLPEWYLQDQARQSVGPSYRSYRWEGHQWALAIDAAAQVSAVRPDLLPPGTEIPRSWDEISLFAKELLRGTWVALPFVPIDAACNLLTICANLAGPRFWRPDAGFEQEVLDEALAVLSRLVAVSHPASSALNPITMLDFMASSDEIAYVPLLFGYSNYSRPGFRSKTISFSNIPSFHGEPRGSVLGGVGLAVSSLTARRQEAVDYAAFVASGECQRGPYFASGGQPGHRSAWIDPGVNEACSHFFESTLRTLDLAYLRPRLAECSYSLELQRRIGELLHEAFITREDIRFLGQTICRIERELGAMQGARTG